MENYATLNATFITDDDKFENYLKEREIVNEMPDEDIAPTILDEEFPHNCECQESLTKDLPELESMYSISVYENLDFFKLMACAQRMLSEKYPDRDREEIDEMMSYIMDRVDFYESLEDEDDPDEKIEIVEQSWDEFTELIQHFMKHKARYDW